MRCGLESAIARLTGRCRAEESSGCGSGRTRTMTVYWGRTSGRSEKGASIFYRLRPADILSDGMQMPDRMSGALSVQNERAPFRLLNSVSLSICSYELSQSGVAYSQIRRRVAALATRWCLAVRDFSIGRCAATFIDTGLERRAGEMVGGKSATLVRGHPSGIPSAFQRQNRAMAG